MRDNKSANRVIDIFELLARYPEGLSLKDINQYLLIPPSSCHALLSTLCKRKYVIKDRVSLTYRLGTKLFDLVGRYIDKFDLIQIADPVMGQMNRLCEEAVSLAILMGTDVVFIHKKTSDQVVRIVNPVGTHLPAHGTALGKTILAELSLDELDVLYPHEYLERWTPYTITSKQTLKESLAKVTEKGIAYDREESRIGVQAVASVIKDHNEFPVAALSIAVPAIHVRSSERWRCLERLVQAGARIVSARLGCASAAGNEELSILGQVWSTN